MKIACIVVATILILALFICIAYSHRQKSKLAIAIVKTLYVGMAVVFIHTNFILCSNEMVAYSLSGIYYALFDWVLIFYLEYVFEYTGYKSNISKFRIAMYIFAIIDDVSLILNAVTRHAFTLKTKMYRDLLIYVVDSSTPVFLLHYLFSYILAIFIVASLLKKIKEVPRFYRRKYWPIMIAFFMIVLVNVFYVYVAVPIDISLPFYIVAAVIMCYFSLYHSPKELVENTLSRIVTELKSGIVCFDIDGKCVYANQTAKEIFKVDENEGIFEKKLEEWQLRMQSEGKESVYWQEGIILDGKDRYFKSEFCKYYDKRKECIGSYYSTSDITEEMENYQRENLRATRDPLTQVYNREHFMHEVQELFEENPDEERIMICSDIKDFKLINELYGEEKGDEVLLMQARLLRKYAHETSIYGRISSDKFAICTEKSEFDEETFVSSIKAMEQTFGSSLFRMHIYMGIYEIKDTSEPVSAMCDKAMMAIRSIKKGYNLHVAHYDNQILEKVKYEKKIVSEFDRAITNKEFCIFLQPQLTAEGKMVGAEALVRWQHPERGLVFPGDFIDVFEKTGLIYRLDMYVWEEVAAKLADWKKRGYTDYYISINISARDFYFLDVYETITALVEKYQVPTDMLKLEITETALMNDFTRQIDVLNDLRKYGFAVEIDDFGSGYSSLNMLKDIEADILKIDMGFLSETENNDKGRSILKSVIKLAKSLDFVIITEGVEEKHQVVMLDDFGCDLYQGYYFEKPISVPNFEKKYFNE